MKCVKELSTDLITRVNDERAHSFVKSGTHVYVARSFWKQSRENPKLPEEKVVKVIAVRKPHVKAKDRKAKDKKEGHKK